MTENPFLLKSVLKRQYYLLFLKTFYCLNIIRIQVLKYPVFKIFGRMMKKTKLYDT